MLVKNGCLNFIKDMDIEESFIYIESTYIEYIDNRAYNRYLFDNLLMQFKGEGMDYMTYRREIGLPVYKNEAKVNIEEARKKAEETVKEAIDLF